MAIGADAIELQQMARDAKTKTLAQVLGHRVGHALVKVEEGAGKPVVANFLGADPALIRRGNVFAATPSTRLISA